MSHHAQAAHHSSHGSSSLGFANQSARSLCQRCRVRRLVWCGHANQLAGRLFPLQSPIALLVSELTREKARWLEKWSISWQSSLVSLSHSFGKKV
jgi:hypothetical protein